MDLRFLEQFCQNKGFEIAQILSEEYDSADFEISGREIEGEIYDVATSYSRILFFEAKEFLRELVRNEVREHLSSRYDSKQVQKMRDIELIAHWIKSEVISALEKENVFLPK